MRDLLWLIPTLPLAAFVALGLIGRRVPQKAVAVIGVLPVVIALAISVVVAWPYVCGYTTAPYTQVLWSWFQVGEFTPQVALYLDQLAVVMTLVVTLVASLILLYSSEYMNRDEEYSRFFAYMNLFVASMLTLVLGENLLTLFLGWEGVGLCSYLLIGFWYKDPDNGRAARKAFIVTRVGDAAMLVGLFLLLSELGTLRISLLLERATAQWPVGSALPVAAAALLLGGAVGKSAQLPLQTWLPDAMAGPTPVSALIHAATMVTAGVYLIARMHPLFLLAPTVLLLVAIIGTVTLLISGFSALVQRDIKRVLAYSTISQIGYMFLGLGVGAWSAAIMHFMTHACFKAALFLAAGVVIHALNDEHDLLKMGGLRKRLPLAFWTFIAAGGALAGFPVVTSGFYSKDLILFESYVSPYGNFWLWLGGVVGVLLTGAYIFRLIFLAFFGEFDREIERRPHVRIRIPLVVLGVLSVIIGLLQIPRTLGDVPAFSRFLTPTFGALPTGSMTIEVISESISSSAAILGIGFAYLFFVRRPKAVSQGALPLVPHFLQRYWFVDWGFDWFYDWLVVRPFVYIAHINRRDVADLPFRGLEWVMTWTWRGVRITQTGRVRWYAAGVVAGAIILIAIVVLQ